MSTAADKPVRHILALSDGKAASYVRALDMLGPILTRHYPKPIVGGCGTGGEKGRSEGEKAGTEGEKARSEGEKPRSEGVNGDFEVLMGAYRNDFRDNARRVFTAIADEPEIDTKRLMQLLGISEISVWRAIRAMKAVGLLVREGGDKGGRWIVKK